jgi:N-acetylmuramoyl-L-alanine amidase
MDLNKLSDRDLLALCLMGESRNQGCEGMLAVAWVVMNRVAKPCWWGSNVREVILRPWQFSCFNSNDPNREMMPTWLEEPDAHPPMPDCLRLADQVLEGLTEDPTGGATHYYERHIAEPAWVRTMRLTCEIGDHKFFA